MKYFLGEAANYSKKAVFRQLFVHGSKRDSLNLCQYLASRYSVPQTSVILSSNGRSALAAGIKALVPKNSQIIVNGFTCQAVIEAVRAAACTPIYADINPKTLHFDTHTLAATLKKHPHARAIIVQNTLGIPLDADESPSASGLPRIFSFAKRQNLIVIEDLAHSAGRYYASGAEMGSLGAAAVLSFGKAKSIDTITGGALILRGEAKVRAPKLAPKLSDSLRARFYPLFGAIARALTPSVFAKIWLAGLIKIHFIEKSADAKLDLSRRPAHWQAKLALEQFHNLPKTPLRDFRLVQNRTEVLAKLAQKGFYFNETWYECPISPARNYQKWQFPEAECPVATKIASEIINLPTIYGKTSMKPALKIIEEYKK